MTNVILTIIESLVAKSARSVVSDRDYYAAREMISRDLTTIRGIHKTLSAFVLFVPELRIEAKSC